MSVFNKFKRIDNEKNSKIIAIGGPCDKKLLQNMPYLTVQF